MKEQELFDLVYDFGEKLLENGAEIKRVELTINHVGQALALKEFDSFVMINGIFLTARCGEEQVQARVKDIPIASISLGRIDAINSLSREVTLGRISPEAARQQLALISQRDYTPNWLKVLAYSIGSGSFCYVFGGRFAECLGAAGLGLLLAGWMLFFKPQLRLSPITLNITSSCLISCAACLLAAFFPQLQLNSLIIGGLISLVPGVAIVNGIRYLFDEDYTSGWSQLIDAVVTSICLSVGVGLGLQLFQWI